MGKFVKPRVQDYTFVNLEQMICDICDEFDEKHDIDIVVTSNESQDVITALMATGKFRPCMIDYSHSEFNEYDAEYIISLYHFDEGELWVEKALCDNGNYKSGDASMVSIAFMSDSVSKKLYNKYENEGHSIVLYNIES